MPDSATRAYAVGVATRPPSTGVSGRLRGRLRAASGATALGVMVLGGLVLAGWWLDVDWLKRVVPGKVSMKANTALCFVLAGLSLWLRRSDGDEPAVRPARSAAASCAVAVLAIAAATLVEYVLDADLGIDRLLVAEPHGAVATAFSGRMASVTALSFVLGGLALLFIDVELRNGVRPSQWLAVVGSFIPLLTVMGYLYSSEAFYSFTSYTRMAVHTAVGFMALFAGVLFVRPASGLMAIVTDNDVSGRLVRRMLPVAILTHGAVAWLCVKGEEAGFYDVHFGVALMVTTVTVMFVAQFGWMARSLRRSERERRSALQAMRKSEEHLRATFEQAAIGLAHVTLDGRWLRVNRKLCNIVGYDREELLQRTFQDITHPDDLDADLKLVEQLLSGDIGEYSMEKRCVRKGGSVVWIRLTVSLVRHPSGEPDYFIAVIQDISRVRQLEEQFRQAQKMEALGRLAGGVAHDFNNQLFVIRGYCELLLKDALPASHRAALEEIHRAALRSTELTSQLLAFSRKQVLQPKIVNLNAELFGIEKMLRRLIGEDIELSILPATNLGSVKVDPGQLQQVIVNLAVNARDAMPDGGKLTLETGSVEIDATYADSYPLARPGRYVVLAVSDSGHGMDRATMARIFEPFFTTKEVGKGTGLGLAMAHGVVTQSGGYIRAYSEPGRCATFKIYLPCVDVVPDAVEADRKQEVVGGSETILLVEDETAVRDVVRRVLEENGYRVLIANNGNHALAVANETGGPIHLLLTDVVTPEMGGAELARPLQAERPGLRVIYMSGYTGNAVVHNGILSGKQAFLSKPCETSVLLRKVREVLDA